jgi:general secretion pathway protein G
MGRRSARWFACAAIVLAPVGVFASLDSIKDYKIVRAFFDLDALRLAVQQWSESHHRLPGEAEGLEALASGDGRALDHVPSDPWHHPYVYRLIREAPGFDLYSAGKDGVDNRGAGDDIKTRDKSYRCETYYDECAGSWPWWRSVALLTSFLAGICWLALDFTRWLVHRARSHRRA